jgi:hypothetical protein
MCRRFGKEFSQDNALSAYQQLAFGLELLDKGFHAGERFVPASAFHLNRNRRLAFLQNEIHFMVSLAPIGNANVRAETGIKQMRADTGFNQPPQWLPSLLASVSKRVSCALINAVFNAVFNTCNLGLEPRS